MSNQLLNVTCYNTTDWPIVNKIDGTQYGILSIIKNIDWSEFNNSNLNQYSFQYFFMGLSAPSIDVANLDVSSVVDMTETFSYTTLNSLDLSTWDTSNVEIMDSMLAGNYYLENLTLGNNWGSNPNLVNLEFNGCTALTKESLLDIAEKLADKSNTSIYKNTYTITFNVIAKEKLSSEELTNFTNKINQKNWTLTWTEYS